MWWAAVGFGAVNCWILGIIVWDVGMMQEESGGKEVDVGEKEGGDMVGEKSMRVRTETDEG